MASRQHTQILYSMWLIKNTLQKIYWFKQRMPGYTMSSVINSTLQCEPHVFTKKSSISERTWFASTRIWISSTKIWQVLTKFGNKISSKCRRVWMPWIQCWSHRYVYAVGRSISYCMDKSTIDFFFQWENMQPKWCHCSKWRWKIKTLKPLCESLKLVKIECILEHTD